MKTTVEIADGLLADAKAIARRKDVTLRELIEDGLRVVVTRERQPKPRFKLRDAAYGKGGLVEGLAWGGIIDVLYEDDPGRGRPRPLQAPAHDRG